MSEKAKAAVREFFRLAENNLHGNEKDLYPRWVESVAADYLDLIRELKADPSPWRAGEISASLEGIARDSESIRSTFDVTVAVLSHLSQQGEPTPRELKTFEQNWLDGRRPPAGRKGRPRESRTDAVIAAVIVALRADSNLRPTQNDATGNTKSACQIVADCLPEAIKDLGCEGVKKAWTRCPFRHHSIRRLQSKQPRRH